MSIGLQVLSVSWSTFPCMMLNPAFILTDFLALLPAGVSDMSESNSTGSCQIQVMGTAFSYPCNGKRCEIILLFTMPICSCNSFSFLVAIDSDGQLSLNGQPATIGIVAGVIGLAAVLSFLRYAWTWYIRWETALNRFLFHLDNLILPSFLNF